MARTVDTGSTFEQWRQNYNDLAADVGDPAALTTGAKDSLVNAVNYIQDQYFFFQDFDYDGSDGASSNTVFSGADNSGNTLQYMASKVLVYKNGLLLRSGTDYVAVNGTTVTLTSSASNSDVVRISSYTGSYTTTPAGKESLFNWQISGANIWNSNTGTANGLVFNANADDVSQLVTAPTVANSIQFEGDVYHNYPVTVGVDGTGHDVKFFGDTAGSYILWDQSADALLLTDSTPIKLGDSQDLQIYHDGSNSRIVDAGTGNLYIQADGMVAFTNAAGTETKASFHTDGASSFRYDNVIKLATVTGGINVTGDTDTDTLTVSGNATIRGNAPLAVGEQASVAASSHAIALGYSASATGSHATAIGYDVTASGSHSVAIGYNGTVSGNHSTLISLDTTARTLSDGATLSVMGGEVGIGTLTPTRTLDVTGTLGVTGIATFTARSVHSGGITVANDAEIGSVGDANSMAIASSGVVTFTQIPILPANTIDSVHYVDGSIDLAHMSANSIDSDQYVDGSIDTVHLSGQAVTLAKIDTNLIQLSSESFTDNDTSLMTSAAVQDKILSYGYTTEVGDITGVTAGTGLTGGGAAGDLTLNVIGGTGITANANDIAITDNSIGATQLNVSGNGTSGYALVTDGDGSFSYAAFSGSNTTYTQEWVDSSNDVILRLNPSAGGNDDLTIVAGSGITLSPSGDNMTIAATAGTPTVMTIADESSDTTCFPLFVTAATGDLGPKSGSNLTFNSSSGLLTATSLAGTVATATQNSITTMTGLVTVGTIGTGTWQGTAINQTYLTGQSGTNTGDQTSVSGNAGTATALATARTIGGVSFDGTANINLPGVNAAGNQNTSGTAATVTTAAQPAITSVGTLTSLTVSGDLTINGTTTTINSTTLSVDDKNIELGSVASPSDSTADGGGITLKGASDKTILWVNSTDSWDFNQAVRSTNGFIGNVTGNTSGTAATVTGGTQASITSAANLATVGTITTGVWSGSIIAEAKLQNQSGTNTGDQTSVSGNAGTATKISSITNSNIVQLAATQTLTNKSGNISQWTNNSNYSTTTGTVDTSGSPVDNDFAKFTDADTIEGRSYAEVRSDLNVADGATANTGTTTASNSQTFTNKGGNISQWTNNSNYSTTTGTLTPTGTVNANEFARFTGATTLEARTASETRSDIGAGTSNLALGSSSSTAYRGDRGTTAYDHSQATHAPTNATNTTLNSLSGNFTFGAGIGISTRDINVAVNASGGSNLTADANGISLTATPAFTTVTATGDITANTSSDIALKENIINIPNPLEKISKIGGYMFDWKDHGYEDVHGKGHDTGILAQEIEEIMPEIVNTRESGMKAVNYMKLIPLLVESIKELTKQVESLKDSKT